MNKRIDCQRDKRTIILDVALQAFSQRSYNDVSVNTIIKQSGSSKGNFYHHFKNKAQLYTALIEESIAAKWRFIDDAVAREPAAGQPGDLFELFRQQARWGVQFAKAHPAYYALSIQFNAERGTPIFAHVAESIDLSGVDVLDQLIDDAFAANYFRADYSRGFIKQVIHYFFNNFDQLFPYSEQQLEDVLKNFEQLVKFLRRGLARS